MISVMSRSAAWLEVEGPSQLKFGGGAADRGGIGCWWTANDSEARLYGLKERLDPVHVGIENLEVSGSKAIGKRTKARAVRVNDKK